MPDEQLAHCRLLPLNQVAALKLKEAGEVECPRELPVLQLMTWGLRTGSRTTHKRTVFELERLLAQNPQEAFDYLTGNLPGGLHELERQLLARSPKAAAELLLDTLDMRLKADPRNPYPA